MAASVFFSTLGLAGNGLDMSGFRENAPVNPKEQALKDAIEKGMEHVELFPEAQVLAYGNEARQLFLKSQTSEGLSPAEVLDLSKATEDIASLHPLLLKGEDGKEATVYARPKAETKQPEQNAAE